MHRHLGNRNVRTLWLLASLVLAATSALASDEEVITVQQVDDAASGMLPGGKETIFTLDNHLCRMEFKTSSYEKTKLLIRWKDRCAETVTYETRLALYNKIISKIFESKFFDGDGEVKFVWGALYTNPPMVCNLIRYASKSVEWRLLNKALGNKPVFFDEESPMPFELGEFIRKSGLFADIEPIFGTRGYRLKSVRVGGFASEYIKRLDGAERKCVADKPIVPIVPNSAELYLLFEANHPAKVDG